MLLQDRDALTGNPILGTHSLKDAIRILPMLRSSMMPASHHGRNVIVTRVGGNGTGWDGSRELLCRRNMHII
jgi:hypothetical protein